MQRTAASDSLFEALEQVRSKIDNDVEQDDEGFFSMFSETADLKEAEEIELQLRCRQFVSLGCAIHCAMLQNPNAGWHE